MPIFTSNERRTHVRFPFHANAILTLFPRYYDAKLVDISLRGALIKIDKRSELRERVPCTLRVLTQEGRQILEIAASTAHCASEGMIGLELCNLTRGEESALQRIIEMNLGTKNLLNRDLCSLLRPRQSSVVTA